MSTSDKGTGDRSKPQEGVRFGGWPDYREWADRDFRQRTTADEPGTGSPSTTVVEVLIQIMAPPPQDTEGIWLDPAGDIRGGVELSFDIDSGAALVRPFVRSGGRVQAMRELQFETVLTATGLHEEWSADRELSADQLRICQQCESPHSLAEIAVVVDAPIGVAKVLVSDAIDQGLLMLHETTSIFEGRPPLTLLKRVHAGLAKLA